MTQMSDDPFYKALLVIEPDCDDTHGRPSYTYDRAAALLRIEPAMLRAWIRHEYSFEVAGEFNGDRFPIGGVFGPDGRKTGERVINRFTLYKIKKTLENEPRPFKPLPPKPAHPARKRRPQPTR